MSIKIGTLKGDIFGGLTSGVIALPLALAFGISSGLGASAGIYGAMILCFFVALFGGTKTQISGPTGPMTVVVASLVGAHLNDFKFIFMTLFLAGAFQILLGLLKIGKYVKYIPYPVISGFMSGIGIIIIILQLNPLIGLESKGDTISALTSFLRQADLFTPECLFLSALTLLIVFFTPKKVANIIPSALIALILVSLLSVVMNFNVPTIGEIPSTLPKIDLSFLTLSLNQLPNIIPIAITLALLGSIDSLLTALVTDSLTKTKHNSNKELIGQGIGNMVTSMFGGLIGASATMRSVANIKSGGKTPFSGIVHCIFLLFVLLYFAKYASIIPQAVLAGILIKVGVDIIDYRILKVLSVAPRSDLIVMFTVLIVTVFDNLIFAVGLGIVLSSILFAIKVAKKTNIDIIGTNDYIFECNCDEDDKKSIRIIKINGVLFFGSASLMLSKIEELFGTKCVIIDFQEVNWMDLSAIFALQELILSLKDKKIKVVLILNNEKMANNILDLGLSKILNPKNVVYNIDNAVAKAKCDI